jgi:hypothetical protein
MKKDVRCTQVPCIFTKNKNRVVTKFAKKEKEWQWRWMQGNYLLTLITNEGKL